MTKSPIAEPAAVVTVCPFCESAAIVTTSKSAIAESYCRCQHCGEVWNQTRLEPHSQVRLRYRHR